MKMLGVCLIITLLAGGLFPVSTVAAGFTEKDRALLIRLDERLNQVDKRFEQMDRRFEQMDKRFNDLRSDMNRRFEQMGQRIDELRFDMNKRFELVDKRFEQNDKRFADMNKRFDAMLKIMLGIVAAFASIVAVAIGFAIWDRRTMIRPFENRTREIEEKISIDHKKLHDLIEILKKYASQDKKLAELLRSLSLL